jgi:diphthamide biosynthesis methyltransferase
MISKYFLDEFYVPHENALKGLHTMFLLNVPKTKRQCNPLIKNNEHKGIFTKWKLDISKKPS